MRVNDKQKGFTLLEVMLAMFVFSISAMGVYTVLQQNTVNTGRLEEKTFAHFVAMNTFAELQVAPTWPGLGKKDKSVDMANRKWWVETEVTKTPSKYLRKVEIRVSLKSEDMGGEGRLSSVLTGYLGEN